MTAIEWLLHPDTSTQMSNSVVHAVVQYAGDVVYVPARWGHAVLNLADCVGIAIEFA